MTDEPPSFPAFPSLDRRRLLSWSAGAAAGTMLGGLLSPRLARAADTVTLGSITPSTGSYGFAGKLVTQGSQLAIEKAGGEILGRKLRYVSRDDEGSSASGIRRLSEAISSDGLSVFNGNYSSDIGLAESAVARRDKVLQYAAGGSEDFTGSRCSRYTFQWSANPYTALKAVLDYITEAHPQARRVYTITADYTFGQALLHYAQVVGKAKNLEFVGNSAHPLGERQYTQYLTQAIAAKPDVLCLLNAGSDAVTCLRQLGGFGAKTLLVTVPWGIEVDQIPELSPEMRDGLVLGENYYHGVDNPANKEFVEAYRSKYNAIPGYASAYAYDSFRTVLMAMREANTVEIPKVVSKMEGWKFDGILGPTTIDADTHQTVRPYFVLRCKPAAAMKGADDFADLVHVGTDNQPHDLNACKGLGPL